MTTATPEAQYIHWTENGEDRSARWRSESGMAPPKRIVQADDTTNADTAYRLACEGTALLWRGDFQNARQLLQALARRADHKGSKGKKARRPRCRLRPPKPSTCTARRSRSAAARWPCC